MNASETAAKVRSGELKAEELIKNRILKIKELNPKLNAFLEIFEDSALAQARAIDAKSPEKRGKLAGVCIALKDNILYKGHIASCASKMLENYKAPYNATVVEHLLKEDAIIIGRANMDEFAMGSSNENSAFGPVRNPLDLERVPGGSSGGSAAAVASGMVDMALGSDTGGSIRQPAAFCGIYGIKPTYGSVSRYGLVAFASSADQIGPLTADLEDNALLLEVLSGYDEKDSTSAHRPAFKAEEVKTEGLRIGIPSDFLENLNPEILARIEAAKAELSSKGIVFEEISLPYAKYASPCYYILTSSEASSNLARFDGLRYGYKDNSAEDLEASYLKNRAKFGPEVKRRIMLGTFSLGSAHAEDYYLKAQKVRNLIKNDFVQAFKQVDAVLMPATPNTAFKLGEKTEDLISLYLSDLYTAPANIAGVPALSFPYGKDSKGLPIGLQFYGNFFDEAKLYALAKLLEK